MDPFMVVIGGMLSTLVVALLLIGRFHPGDGSKVLDWSSQRPGCPPQAGHVAA